LQTCKVKSFFKIEICHFDDYSNYRTVEALAVVIVVHSLHPAITGFDRVSTSVTLGGKQLIPIFIKKIKCKLIKLMILKLKMNRINLPASQ
jgi:hypothetical protein